MRVSLDLDTRNQFKMLSAYFNLKHLFPDEVKVRDSPTKRGYHIIAWGCHITKEQNLELRRLLADDPARIYLDEEILSGKLHKPFQLIWTAKRVHHVWHHAEETDPLALPWKMVGREVMT